MNHKLWSILTLLTAMAFSMGCQSGPSASESTVGNSNYLVTALDAQRIGYVPRWAMNFVLGEGQELAYVAALGDLVVVVEHPSNWVIGIDANDGSIRWRSRWLSETERLYQPSRANDRILVNSSKQLFHLDPRNGRVRKISRLEEQVSDGPVISDHLAIFGSGTGRVFAHDVTTGMSRWTADMAAAVTVQPIVVEQSVLATDTMGVYTLLDLQTGERLWTGRTFAQISAKPVASDNTQLIYIPSQDQNLYAVNRATGRDRWIYRTTQPFLENPVLLGNTLLLTQRDTFTAVDAISGNRLWQREGNFHAVDLIDQRLIVNGGVYLMILDVTTGKTIREVPFIEPIKRVLVGENDSLIVVSPTGKLERLDAQR